MIKFFQQSQALTSHFESFWSIVTIVHTPQFECKRDLAQS